MSEPQRSPEPPRSIEVDGVVKRFGPVLALAGVSLQVPGGHIAALLGPNGAGKSTLLRILATTVLPDAGTAQLAGRDVVRDPLAARQATGFMLNDERSWYWRLSGRQNLEFFGALHRLSRADARRRAGELLSEVGLADAGDRPFMGYSSGMRLRLSLARALLSRPGVMLLDEPTRSLDPLSTVAFRDTLREITAQRGAAVLFATHDLHEAAALADEVVVLHTGHARSVGGGHDAAALEQLLVDVAR